MNFGENTKFHYIDTDSFIFHVETEDIYKDIVEEVEKRFDTSSFELHRILPKGKNRKVIGLIKDKLGEQILKEFVGLRAKTYSYLKGNNDEDKKSKKHKKVCHKKKT